MPREWKRDPLHARTRPQAITTSRNPTFARRRGITAIIPVSQATSRLTSQSTLALRNQVTASFLAGFSGCLVAAFPVVAGSSLLFIATGSARALVVHSREEDYRLPSRVTTSWVLVMTLFSGLMILMT